MNQHPDSVARQDIEELLRQARAGSREALGQALEAYRLHLLRLARLRLKGELQAKCGGSDLVQDTFLEAQRHFEQFRGMGEAEFRAWLSRILVNTAASFRRRYGTAAKRAAGREVSLTDPRWLRRAEHALAAGPPDAELVRREQVRAVRRALQQLPDHARETVRLHSQERLSFEDIARRLDCSPDAARKIFTRALQVIADRLDGLGD